MGFQGYRAQVVTYAVARLSNALHRRLPWEQIWQEQEIPDAIRAVLARIIVGARDVIAQPTANKNITEWCKRDECWALILQLDIAVGPSEDLTGLGGQSTGSAEIVAAIAAVPQEVWSALSRWARDSNSLQAWQRALSYHLSLLRGRGERPSSKQAAQGRTALLDALRLGFVHQSLSPDLVDTIEDTKPAA
jgi:hypothetical protein